MVNQATIIKNKNRNVYISDCAKMESWVLEMFAIYENISPLNI